MTGKTATGIILAFLLLFVSCAPSTVRHPKGAVAVWDLDDLSPSGGVQSDMGELLSSQIIETLQKSGEYTVVERSRLLLALEELRLGTTSLADEATRLKLGKVTGARYMVFGGYQAIGMQMRLDLRLVDVETAKVVRAVQKTASVSRLTDWMDAVRQAAEALFQLGPAGPR